MQESKGERIHIVSSVQVIIDTPKEHSHPILPNILHQ